MLTNEKYLNEVQQNKISTPKLPNFWNFGQFLQLIWKYSMQYGIVLCVYFYEYLEFSSGNANKVKLGNDFLKILESYTI